MILIESDESCEKSAKKVSDKIEAIRGSHKKWAAKFVFCEFANFGIAISQFYFTDLFLGGEFMEYGTEMLEFATQTEPQECHPMTRVCIAYQNNTRIIRIFLSRSSQFWATVNTMPKVQEVVIHLMATSAFSLRTSGIRSFTSSSTSGWFFSFLLAFLKLSTASSQFSAGTSGRVKCIIQRRFYDTYS